MNQKVQKSIKGGRIHRTKAQKLAVSRKIMAQYIDGECTLESICKSFNVSPRTFRNWVKRPTLEEIKSEINRGFIAEVAALYEANKEEAWQTQDRNLLSDAYEALRNRLTGFYYEEVHQGVHIGNDTGKITKRVIKIIKKYCAPSVKLIIWTLENLDPKTWKNEESAEVKKCTCDDLTRSLNKMSTDELWEEVKRLRLELGGKI